MLHILKYTLYAALILIALFLFWFLPKYNFVHKNPGYCVNLTKQIYYCGTDANLESFYNLFKK